MVKKLTALLTLALVATAHTAPTPIKELKLTGTADGGGHTITNLAPGASPSSAATLGQLISTNTATLDDAKAYTDLKINDMPQQGVTSVNAKTGTVVITAADVGALSEEGGVISGHGKAIEFQNDDTEMVIRSTGVTGSDSITGNQFGLSLTGLYFEDFQGHITRYLGNKMLYNGGSFFLPDKPIGNYILAVTSDLSNYLPLTGGEMKPLASVFFPAESGKLNGANISPFEVSVIGPSSSSMLTPWSIIVSDNINAAHLLPNAIVTKSGTYTLPDKIGNDKIALVSEVSSVAEEFGGNISAAITDLIASSNGWLTVSNGTLTVYAITNPVAPAAAIWSSAETSDEDLIPPAVTNQIWQAINVLNTTVNAKADKAWGQYAPDGSSNPDPGYMTFLNAPATMFASGAQWATAGAYAVYATTGAAAFMAGDQGGELRIGPDVTTNYFGYKMGGSYMVGARTDGIKVFNHGTEYGYVELTYDSYGTEDPYTIWMTPDLRSVEWSIVEPVWVDDGETAVATVPATTAKCFFRATTMEQFDSVMYSKMPASFEGGIFGDPNAPPVVADSTIIISHGGKSYRVIAEEVQ